MAAHFQALTDALAAAPPGWAQTPGVLQVGNCWSRIHADERCENGHTGAAQPQRASLAELAKQVPHRDSFRICLTCQFPLLDTCAEADDQVELWELASAYEETQRARSALMAVQQPEETDLGAYAKEVLDLAAVFFFDSVHDFWTNQGYGPLSGPALKLIAAQWEAGQTLYSELLGTQVASRHLSEDPDTVLVVCSQGYSFVAQWRFHCDDLTQKLQQVALMEGARLGQARNKFITRATWPAGTQFALTPSTFEDPNICDPAAYAIALEVWDGQDAAELTGLVRSADTALRT
jgi:hypothetical protein